MAILSKGINFSTGEQVTADKLDALVDSATFVNGAVDDSTTQLSGGAIIVKDSGITTNKIASGVNISFNSGSAGSPSITHNGDTDTGIFFGTNEVIVSCSGQRVATFAYNEQGGEIQINDSTGAGTLLIDQVNGTGRVLKVGTGFLEVGTTGAGSFRLVQNGGVVVTLTGSNVGIGTGSPSTRLDVNGGITVSDGVRGGLKYGTSQFPATPVASVEFTGIPSWAKRVTIVFAYVNATGSTVKQFQLGTSSSLYANTTYAGSMSNSSGYATHTTGLGLRSSAAADVCHGTAVFTNYSGNAWMGVCDFSLSNAAGGGASTSTIGLTGQLDRIRLVTVGNTNFNDADMNIIYEG